MVARNMNCHIGSMRDGFEDVIGCFSFGVRNHEGENMLGLGQEHNLRVMNSYYQKKREHLITYKSGGNESRRDYVLCRRHEELRTMKCKERHA